LIILKLRVDVTECKFIYIVFYMSTV
jgi:hypothetical protein